MRLVIRLAKPYLLYQPVRSLFCTHAGKIQAIKNTFKLHKQYMQSQEESIKHFTDAYLYGLVQQNYCFADIVDICNTIIYSFPGSRSDQQIIFLAYGYNLFFSELKKGKELIEIITKSLTDRISKKQYKFSSYQLEKHYLINIKAFTNRDNHLLESEIITLKNTFFKFITLKYDLVDQSLNYKQISERTLSNLVAVGPYIPKDGKGSHFFSALEKHYLQVLRYQFNHFLLKQDQMSKNFQKDVITRFTLLMEFGVTLGKLQDKFINIFPSLPTSFSSQKKFIFYLKVIRQFFTYQLIKRLDYKLFDKFNEELSRNNNKYRSAESMKAFEQYVQSLIVLRVNNLRSFNPYFLDESDHQQKGK